jgi:HK97 family phage major capsid protein
MDLKEKLKRVEAELAAKRDERAQAVKEREAAKEAFASADGYDTDSQEFKDADAAIKKVSGIDQEIADLQAAQVGILRMLGESDPAVSHTPASPDAVTDGETWDARAVVDAHKDVLARAATSKGRFGSIELGSVATREALAADIGNTQVAGLIQPDRRGLVAPIWRALRFLDVLPTGTTDSNLIEYTKMTTRPEQAAETAPGAVKPEAAIALEDDDAPVRTIAAWLKVRKQTLADAAGLRSLIDTALRYDVRRRVEAQALAGNGTGENITGILNTTGILAPTVTAGESHADRIHHGIVAVQLADQEPSVVVLHPRDNEDIRLSRDNSGAGAGTGGYLFGPPSQAGAATIWGLPTVVSQAIPEGTALVCDPMGAMLLFREGVNVLISDSDQDDFIRNRVTLLGECRAGLPVFRPDAFAEVNLGAV